MGVHWKPSEEGAAMKVVVPLLVCAIALAAVASAKPQLGEYLERAKKPGGKPGKPGKPGNAGGKPGKPGKPGKEEKGLCLNTDEVSMLCMSNSAFGTKFGGVYQSCKEDNEEEEGEEGKRREQRSLENLESLASPASLESLESLENLVSLASHLSVPMSPSRMS